MHFLAAGFVLFVVFALLQPERFAADASRRIELSPADVARVELAFMSRWQRPPTEAELHGLLSTEIRTEVLAREAVALGLDKDDIIVKRRLAQKMEFLAEDTSALRAPTRDELQAWYGKHGDELAAPSRITFRHVYFSIDKRGAPAEAAARRALGSATATSVPKGDDFMFQDTYAEKTPTQVAQDFGADFATAVFAAPVGHWTGPIASGLGWHLVMIDDKRLGKPPSFEDAEAEVRDRWISEQREANKRATFDSILARYEVVLPGQRQSPLDAAKPARK